MTIKKLLATVPLLLLQFGCSYQPPAPIYGGRPDTNPYETTPIESYPDNRTIEQSVLPEEGVNSTEIITQRDTKPQFKSPVMSPAVVALMNESDRKNRAGELDSAVAVLERALRINPRNPTLTFKLAKLRIKQGKPRLAEDLAKKAALLAAGDVALKRKSWLLISEARRKQQNYHGAKEAKLKAERFVSP